MEFTCRDCKLTLDSSLSTSHQKTLCKPCAAVRMNKWRAANPERAKEIVLKSHLKRSDFVRARRRRYYLSGKEKRSARLNETSRLWRINNREKVNAKGRVEYAVKTGRLKKPDACSFCGNTVCIVAHHYDYSKPLDVTWLCQSCHRRLHSRHHHAIQDAVKR